MPRRDVVLIGASAGGLEPLLIILDRLPFDLHACLLVVMHTPAEASGALASILDRNTKLAVSVAVDGDRLRHGHVYVAPPDHHLIVDKRSIRIVRGPRENGFRPAIDPLFRTAAREFDGRVVAIILSGALDDGMYGLSVVKQRGGIAIVQDPDEALVSSMPRSAIDHVDVDYIEGSAAIAGLITRLSSEELEGETKMARRKQLEPQLPAEGTEVSTMREMYGAPSALTCPDCGGALWEIEDGRLVRYQCHTGHQFAPDSLQAEQHQKVDSALWNAVRVLEEHAELKLRMARRAESNGLSTVSAGFEDGAREAHHQAQQIRAVLFAADNGGAGSETDRAPANPGLPAATTAPTRGRPLDTRARRPQARRRRTKKR
ncbi:MAG TPA: chemotaxis protein CheB [Vicinamibacterales bacterium]|jgi:two-component system chemotaxis response regulator CheB|nr:chemotaxis protein CheB [Vicinamibacterales bacterium]